MDTEFYLLRKRALVWGNFENILCTVGFEVSYDGSKTESFGLKKNLWILSILPIHPPPSASMTFKMAPLMIFKISGDLIVSHHVSNPVKSLLGIKNYPNLLFW
jgi:hypothetical protein